MSLDIWFRELFLIVAVVSGVPLILSSAVGFVVAIVQAVTQIQEQSVPYLAKLLTVIGAAVLLGSVGWSMLETFTRAMLMKIAAIGEL